MTAQAVRFVSSKSRYAGRSVARYNPRASAAPAPSVPPVVAVPSLLAAGGATAVWVGDLQKCARQKPWWQQQAQAPPGQTPPSPLVAFAAATAERLLWLTRMAAGVSVSTKT